MREIFGDTIEVRPGRRVFCRKFVVGNPKALPDDLPEMQLFCVHGLSASELQFHLMLQSLHDQIVRQERRQIDCYLYDWISCGQSPLILDDWNAYGKEESQADFAAILAKYRHNDVPVVVICHSYAPSIALPVLKERYLTGKDAKLDGIVLCSTALRRSEREHADLMPDGGLNVFRLPVPILQCLQPMMTRAFCDMAIHPRHTSLIESVKGASNQNNMYASKAYNRHMEWERADVLHPATPSWPPPVLVVHGESDGLIPIYHGQALANQVGTELKVITEASHLVLLEQPDSLATEVLQFLLQVAK